MKKGLIFMLLTALMSGGAIAKSEAQDVLDNIYVKEHIASHKPVPYPSIREADIMWSKRIWRIIDLREKMNIPLYYPTTKVDDRFSLIDLLMHGIRYEGLTPYSTRDDEFKVKMGTPEVMEAMGATIDTTEVLNPTTGLMEMKIIENDVRSDEVKQILVKEVWYFDRNYSRLDVRILGICPIREYVNDEGVVLKRQTFWVYFPEARPLLARHEVFATGNDAQRRSFDDLFIKRYFGSYIVKESNAYNNRGIETYAVGVDAMLESNRIRNEIFQFEHDLWEF
ncbi:MAG: gliding motility protein GldN [Cytophagaceae bacterium]|jgi:gliding motility associated protien GldN|nr:gliding motility protein GldN [Cytophagaceae bacterium]